MTTPTSSSRPKRLTAEQARQTLISILDTEFEEASSLYASSDSEYSESDDSDVDSASQASDSGSRARGDVFENESDGEMGTPAVSLFHLKHFSACIIVFFFLF